MASAAAVEEARLEVEAVEAVYGDDCCVIEVFPPHLTVHIRPRTADDSSQQFVEVILGIKSSVQYPEEPADVYFVETKGLDEKRQAHLISSIQLKAQELSSCQMVVALCEKAVEILSEMNHPEGNCPLCLHPLLAGDKNGASLPFMKLMSCYHCFHSECIIRWWNWLQERSTNTTDEATAANIGSQRVMHGRVNQHKGSCPVCRKMFAMKDIEHVLDYRGTESSQLNSGMDIDEDEKLFLQSESENNRRQKFEAILKLQQENCGLNEPKKNLVILPGMFLPEAVGAPNTAAETSGEFRGDSDDIEPSEMGSNSSMNRATTSKQKNSGTRRKNRVQSARRHVNAQPTRKQWIKKEVDASGR